MGYSGTLASDSVLFICVFIGRGATTWEDKGDVLRTSPTLSFYIQKRERLSKNRSPNYTGVKSVPERGCRLQNIECC